MKPTEQKRMMDAMRERDVLFSAVASNTLKKSACTSNQIEVLELARDQVSDAIGAGFIRGTCSDMLAFGIPHKAIRALRGAKLLVDCAELENGRSVFEWTPLLNRLVSIVGPRVKATAITPSAPSKTAAAPTQTATAKTEPTEAQLWETYRSLTGQAKNDFYNQHRKIFCPDTRHWSTAE